MFGIFEELDETGPGLSVPALVLMFGIFEELDRTGSQSLVSSKTGLDNVRCWWASLGPYVPCL